jgi:hypothetical protein
MKTITMIITLSLLAACGGGDDEPEPVCAEWLYVLPAQDNNAQPALVCARWQE